MIMNKRKERGFFFLILINFVTPKQKTENLLPEIDPDHRAKVFLILECKREFQGCILNLCTNWQQNCSRRQDHFVRFISWRCYYSWQLERWCHIQRINFASKIQSSCYLKSSWFSLANSIVWFEPVGVPCLKLLRKDEFSNNNKNHLKAKWSDIEVTVTQLCLLSQRKYGSMASSYFAQYFELWDAIWILLTPASNPAATRSASVPPGYKKLRNKRNHFESIKKLA